jgi:hypothetical protein
MKKIIIKLLVVLPLIFAMTVPVKATTFPAYPAFYFMYKDNYPGSTYDVSYRVENTDSWNSGWISIGNSYTLGSWNYFQSGSIVYVQIPAPPIPAKPYRIVVRVIKDSSTIRYGISDWTTDTGIQDGSLYISVTSF